MPSFAAQTMTPPPIPSPVRARARGASWAPQSARQSMEERLFDLRRDSIARSGQLDPVARVAALLLSIASNNSYEGRDPCVVPTSLTSGFVADLVGMNVDALASVLRDLETRGLVETSADSTLRLKDLGGLSGLASVR